MVEEVEILSTASREMFSAESDDGDRVCTKSTAVLFPLFLRLWIKIYPMNNILRYS